MSQILNDMNVWGEGNRKPGPLEIERDVDFASLCRMEVIHLNSVFDQDKGFPSDCSQTHLATRPNARFLVCLH